MRVKSQHQTFSDGLKSFSQLNDAERLRLALVGASEAVFDWTIADDRIVWDGADFVLAHHPDPSRLESAQAFRAWLSPSVRSRLLAFVENNTADDQAFTVEFDSVSATGIEWFELCAVRISGEDGKAERVTGVVRIVTEQKQNFERLSYLAAYDELTGHLNRTRLREELARIIDGAIENKSTCAYVVAAIDSLAVINETYGFDVADEVIVATGQRLAHSLRDTDIIGRTAGNKFGIVLGECGERELSLVAERLHAAVRSEPISTRAGSISITISIGAVWLPENAANSQEAMLRAEDALERAKAMGRNGFVLFEKSEQRESMRRRLVAISGEIMGALEDNRIVLAYQPIVGAVSRKAEHYECLVRLARPDGSIMPAGEIVPAAETLGLVRLIDRRILETAVEKLYDHPAIKLSINVSGTTAADQSWLHSFIAYVREHKAVAERMTVELTETAALHTFEENAKFITSLRDMGCRVAIDDFGAGYTSFRNLRNLRVDMVKIDGAYVKNLSSSPDNQLFVRTLVELAKNFKLETVAEWVSSEEDAELLAAFGVDYFQGFHFGTPEIAPVWMKHNVVRIR